ncbi:hypothetical protein PGT21_037317 [Puccinia graminis f. sp. tritici]|uniref:SAM domain-containing protein n=1 Tax=Puccinia graminis f. sp. tritici TaxID=56615 RepID=A0A5B0R3Z1_PUCGR|nr:hypothetical protein PGT21_037317 [Puccinia graminis f. sp. tritici]
MTPYYDAKASTTNDSDTNTKPKGRPFFILYNVLARICREGKKESQCQKLKSDHFEPIMMNIHDLNYTRLKRLVIEHIRKQSQQQSPPYPIDVIAVYAEYESALQWYYAAVPKSSPIPVDFVHTALTESSFDAFVKEVENAPDDYRLWIEICMCSLNKIEKPEAIISIMVSRPIVKAPHGQRSLQITFQAPDQESQPYAPTTRPLSAGVAILDLSNCLIDDVSYVPIKRDSESNNQSPAKKRIRFNESTSNMSLADFLGLCSIPIDNKHVREMIETHKILDWQVFIGTSLTELTQLGFKWGPARSILAGVAKATESREAKR